MRASRLFVSTAAVAATAFVLALTAGPAAAGVRAYAGVVAGNASGSGGFACATSGPTIAGPWFAGLVLPTEGYAGCNLAGAIDDKSAAAGTVVSTMSASGPMAGGVGIFSGSADARAAVGALGVAAGGSASGGSSTFTYRQSAAFASFTDTWTLHSAGIAAGTAGSLDLGFLIHGSMTSASVAPYTQQADVALGIRFNGSAGVWDSYAATLINQNLPFVRGGSTGLPGGFTLAPGSLSGQALVTSSANFSFQWDVPFTVEVALRASASPCCYGTTQAIDFLSTATLAAVVARNGGQAVSDFSVATESGTAIGPNGLLPVPEPASSALWGAGIAALLLHRRRRVR